jgi:hypothetical protein
MTNGQVPTAAMADIAPAMPQVAPQASNPGQSAYAGAVGGATQASVGQQGSPMQTGSIAA